MATAAELAQRAADIQAVEDDEITWNGADYPCTVGELAKSDSPELGGFERAYDMSVYIRTELFTGRRPNMDDAVRYKEKGMKIVGVRQAPDDIAIELELKSASGN